MINTSTVMSEETTTIEINEVGCKDEQDGAVRDNRRNTIIREGFMVKKGHVRHNWKSRWFLLFTDKLCYYKSKGDLIPKGSIMLKGSSVISPDPEYTKKESVFRLIEIKGTEYLIQCSDEAQREEWVKAITSTIRSLNTVLKSNSLKYSDRPTLHSPAPSPETAHKNLDNDALVILQNRVSLEDLLQAMQDKEAGLQLKTHKIGEEFCKLCFAGESLIAWLVSWGFVKSRKEGCVIAVELLEKAYLHPIGESNVPLLDSLKRKTARKSFNDRSDCFYRFSAILNNNDNLADVDGSDSNDEDSEEESILDNLQAIIVKQGFLVKKGHKRHHNWKLRKFILYDEPIRFSYYSPTKETKRKKGKINLFGSHVHTLKSEYEKEDKCCGVSKENKKVLHDHCFSLTSCKGKECILQAPSEGEMNDWVKHLEYLIEKYENCNLSS